MRRNGREREREREREEKGRGATNLSPLNTVRATALASRWYQGKETLSLSTQTLSLSVHTHTRTHTHTLSLSLYVSVSLLTMHANTERWKKEKRKERTCPSTLEVKTKWPPGFFSAEAGAKSEIEQRRRKGVHTYAFED